MASLPNQQLDEIERALTSVSEAVATGEPDALVGAANALRQAAVNLSSLMGQGAPAIDDRETRLRLKRIADGLAIQREGLIRRTVAVERAVQTLLPNAPGNQDGLTYDGARLQAAGQRTAAYRRVTQ